MTYDGSDTIILYEELAYQDNLSLAWRPLPDSTSGNELVARFTEGNLKALQTALALDEHSTGEKPDENSPHSADLLRLDLKMNLLLDLVGKLLVDSHPRPKPAAVRFNSVGASWHAAAPLPPAGTQGLLEIYLGDCMPEPLRLIARVTGVSQQGEIKVKFLPPGDAIADLIEKLTFRHHRRHVAGARQPRRG